MLPICVKCKRSMKPEKNGVYVGYTDSSGEMYKIYHADLVKCPGCGDQVIAGFGRGPFVMNFPSMDYPDAYAERDKFAEVVDRLKNSGEFYIEVPA